MKRVLLAGLACFSVVGSSLAIDFKAGIGYTSLSPSGYVKYKGDSIDAKGDLNLGHSNKVNGYVELGLPIIPNIKVEYLPVEYSGSNRLSRTIQFSGKNYTANADVSSKIKLDQLDVDLYYRLPIPAPFIKPRLGLAVKYVDGNIKVDSSTLNLHENKSFKAPLPLVYAGVYAEIPNTPIAFDLEAKGITYSGSSFIDFKGLAMVHHKIANLGDAYIGAGYRYQRLKIDDISSVYSDLKFKGFTIETGIAF